MCVNNVIESKAGPFIRTTKAVFSESKFLEENPALFAYFPSLLLLLPTGLEKEKGAEGSMKGKRVPS